VSSNLDIMRFNPRLNALIPERVNKFCQCSVQNFVHYILDKFS